MSSEAVQRIIDRCENLDSYIASLQALRQEFGGDIKVTSWRDFGISRARVPAVEHVAEPHGRKRRIDYWDMGMNPSEQTKGIPVVRV